MSLTIRVWVKNASPRDDVAKRHKILNPATDSESCRSPLLVSIDLDLKLETHWQSEPARDSAWQSTSSPIQAAQEAEAKRRLEEAQRQQEAEKV